MTDALETNIIAFTQQKVEESIKINNSKKKKKLSHIRKNKEKWKSATNQLAFLSIFEKSFHFWELKSHELIFSCGWLCCLKEAICSE